jgi:hypothetical protein
VAEEEERAGLLAALGALAGAGLYRVQGGLGQ